MELSATKPWALDGYGGWAALAYVVNVRLCKSACLFRYVQFFRFRCATGKCDSVCDDPSVKVLGKLYSLRASFVPPLRPDRLFLWKRQGY
jgi:hypothetical protein